MPRTLRFKEPRQGGHDAFIADREGRLSPAGRATHRLATTRSRARTPSGEQSPRRSGDRASRACAAIAGLLAVR